ncbi:GNAT family N-acetyltransferase [Nonomuraea sp. NPDC050394]|uniref:GNAT family N-acetyltransferase n=1 Tax=Nonomuraea sp. NPDC050394 TaxID=3364363 RepID=UPI0037B4D8F6
MGDGMVAIRRAGTQDGERLLDLRLALDAESSFMMLEPGERDRTTDVGPFVVVADDSGVAAGYVEVEVLPYARARRTGYVVMGVRAAYGGQGLGRRLLEAAVEQAGEEGLRRLELTVMCHNRRALGLYAACGFLVEGLRRSALDVAGERVDEYYMGLVLP